MSGTRRFGIRPQDEDVDTSLTMAGPAGPGATTGSTVTPRDHDSDPDGLQTMVLDSADVQCFLTTLARHAARELSATDHRICCGITLLRPRTAETVASSDDHARAMDEVQYRFGDGPCLDAAGSHRTNYVRDVTTDGRWPEYLSAVAGTGVGSILGVPIPLEGEATCALNLYADSTAAFTEQAIREAEEFARRTSATLRLAVRIARLTDAEKNLTAALRSRTTIDLAAGIVMAQNRSSQEDAMVVLKTASSVRNTKLHTVAAAVIRSVSDAGTMTHFER